MHTRPEAVKRARHRRRWAAVAVLLGSGAAGFAAAPGTAGSNATTPWFDTWGGDGTLTPLSASVHLTFTDAGPDPTGTISMLDNGVHKGSATVLAGCYCANIKMGPLGAEAGEHLFTARYSGDDVYAASEAQLTTLFAKRGISGSLKSSNPDVGPGCEGRGGMCAPEPIAPGESVTYTATLIDAEFRPDGVPPSRGPAGHVTFTDYYRNVVLGTAPVVGSGARWTASFTTQSLAVGYHHIVATHNGDISFGGFSAGPVMQQVVAPSSPSAQRAPSSSLSAPAGRQPLTTGRAATTTPTASGARASSPNGLALAPGEDPESTGKLGNAPSGEAGRGTRALGTARNPVSGSSVLVALPLAATALLLATSTAVSRRFRRHRRRRA